MEKITEFFVGRAYAVDGGNLWTLFNPFSGATSGPLDATRTTQSLFSLIITWLLAIAALIAFIYLVMSGINYITAGGDAEKATKARAGILNAVIGIVVIVLAFIIIRFATGLGSAIKTGVGA